MSGKRLMVKGKSAGYSLLIAVIAVNIFAVFLLMARSMWETEIRRDLEEELIFRARQYVKAIELYKQKHVNLYPKTLEVLYEEKFLRKQYKDPMTELGKWNIVMKDATGGQGGSLLIVPEDMLPQFEAKAFIVGVCSTSSEEGFRTYRKKKRYNEWAIYEGEDPQKDMPELKYVGEASGSTGDRQDDESQRGEENRGSDEGRGGDESQIWGDGRGRDESRE